MMNVTIWAYNVFNTENIINKMYVFSIEFICVNTSLFFISIVSKIYRKSKLKSCFNDKIKIVYLNSRP